ncbi:MAG: RusA family crossover junction endodeoxyribonuclease [Lachnospiraceae bacterium]|nr:RusA family crossover junction endodeoxyribonuclease [Lachnospiraceae bacterium]
MKIVIPIAPITKKNHQQIVKAGNRRMVIPSKQYRQYEADCLPFLKAMHIDYPVNVRALYYMPTRRRVDLVNLHEALCDVLVKYGVLEDDNSKIIVSMDGSRVLYDKQYPRTEVYIEEVETPGQTCQ